MNKVILIGKLTKEAEIRNTHQGPCHRKPECGNFRTNQGPDQNSNP